MTDIANIRKERHFDDRVVNCFAERPRRIMDKIDYIIDQHPDNEAIIDGERRVTYSNLADQVATTAAHLRALGLKQGERIGIVAPNRLEFVTALLAAWRLGAVPVPLNTRESGAEAAFILSDCAAAGLIYDSDFPGALPPADAVDSLRWRLSINDVPDVVAEPMRDPAPADINEDDVAAIAYTSGTTGKPKGAMLTHLGIVHSALHFEHHLGIGPDDTSLLVVPATHITGLIGLIAASLGAGAKLIMMREFETRHVVRVAERERMTFTIMVPAMYNLLLMREDLSAHDLSCWRIGAYGGAVMPESTIRKLAHLLPGLNLANAYGATETTSPTSIVPIGSDSSVHQTIGKPVACAEVLVMDDSGRQLPAGEVGEFWVRGPMVVPGYWNRPDANKSEFIGGFWRTGDIGEMSADGFMRIHDRRKDLVNRGGYKVFSAEVEMVLKTHPNVIEVAVVPRPCKVLGERVNAFVQLDTPMDDTEELTRLCAAQLSDFKVPETYTLTTELLPRNANGKILKRQLRESLTEVPVAPQ